MPPKKRDLGRLIDVLQGKTLHPAFLLNEPGAIIKGEPRVWVTWVSTGQRDYVPEQDVREPTSRRSRRQPEMYAPVVVSQKKKKNETAAILGGGSPAISRQASSPAVAAAKDDTDFNRESVRKRPMGRKPKKLRLRERSESPLEPDGGAAADDDDTSPKVRMGDYVQTRDIPNGRVIGESYCSPRKGKHPRQLQIKYHDSGGAACLAFAMECDVLQVLPTSPTFEAFDDDDADDDDADEVVKEEFASVEEVSMDDDNVEESDGDESVYDETLLRQTRKLVANADFQATTLKTMAQIVMEACDLPHTDKNEYMVRKHIWRCVSNEK